jgi:hypothetical protein
MDERDASIQKRDFVHFLGTFVLRERTQRCDQKLPVDNRQPILILVFLKCFLGIAQQFHSTGAEHGVKSFRAGVVQPVSIGDD